MEFRSGDCFGLRMICKKVLEGFYFYEAKLIFSVVCWCRPEKTRLASDRHRFKVNDIVSIELIHRRSSLVNLSQGLYLAGTLLILLITLRMLDSPKIDAKFEIILSSGRRIHMEAEDLETRDRWVECVKKLMLLG